MPGILETFRKDNVLRIRAEGHSARSTESGTYEAPQSCGIMEVHIGDESKNPHHEPEREGRQSKGYFARVPSLLPLPQEVTAYYGGIVQQLLGLDCPQNAINAAIIAVDALQARHLRNLETCKNQTGVTVTIDSGVRSGKSYFQVCVHVDLLYLGIDHAPLAVLNYVNAPHAVTAAYNRMITAPQHAPAPHP